MQLMNFGDFKQKKVESSASFVSVLCAWLDHFYLGLRTNPEGLQHSPLCCLQLSWSTKLERVSVYIFYFVLSNSSSGALGVVKNLFAW